MFGQPDGGTIAETLCSFQLRIFRRVNVGAIKAPAVFAF